VNNEHDVENVNIRHSPNRWKGDMEQSQSTLVETVGLNGQRLEIRRYEIGDKIEFRFPWRDAQGKRHFRCCRTLDEARQAAEDFCSSNGEVKAPTSFTKVKQPELTPELLVVAARMLGVQVASIPTFHQTLSEVCDEFMSSKKGKLERREIRADTYKELQSRVRNLKELMGPFKVDDLTAERMDKSMSRLTVGARSVSNCRDALRAVLRWAVNRSKAPDSVLKQFNGMAVTGSKAKDAEKIDPFNCEEVVALLKDAMENKFDPTQTNYRMVAVIALQAFAGLRAAEACKLPWEQIDLGNGLIRITADIAKLKRARTIEISANLHKWLKLVPQQGRHGPIYTNGAYSKAQGRLARRVAAKLEGFRWRDNALRQAFIAHTIAVRDSISETAYLAGTSESKIRTNYWKLVSKSDGAAYFGIVP
jgi:integrase